jgi:sec-independent protein translocase protein TatA
MGLDNPLHLAFIVVLLLLVFGAKRLPEMGRSLGAGMRGFKESINGESPAHHESITAAQAAPQATPPAPVPAATGEPAGAEREQPVQPAG